MPSQTIARFTPSVSLQTNCLADPKQKPWPTHACLLRHLCQGRLTAALFTVLLTAVLSGPALAQQPSQPGQPQSTEPVPLHDGHSSMNDRGEKGMGFSQTATTHHFFLRSDGGAIQVEANDPNDTAARDTIRTHLTHIVHAFSEGDFDIPMFVHDTTPPGVREMKRLKNKITYTFREIPAGGRVLISTADPEALAAIHKFLTFQIDEHQTHDPTSVR